jgi:hypothetical protein
MMFPVTLHRRVDEIQLMHALQIPRIVWATNGLAPSTRATQTGLPARYQAVPRDFDAGTDARSRAAEIGIVGERGFSKVGRARISSR